MENQIHIGDLARQAGVAPSLVRYYEEIGLLPPATRNESGYRIYRQADVERLRFIQRAKALDFSLEEIGEILGLRERGEAPCAYVLNQIGAKMAEVDRKMAALARLKWSWCNCKGKPLGCPWLKSKPKAVCAISLRISN